MIVFDLLCDQEHRFEAWFSSTEDFERQAGTPMLVCPVCGSGELRKAPAGRHVARHGRGERAAPPAQSPAQGTEQDPGHVAAFSPAGADLLQAFRKILENAENVGERFPEEARRIHYGESARRSIRGQASRDEAEALREEGIEVLSLPAAMGEDLH
ncbi:MAG: DUF1178 family protein [Betaproteobacteria bacterium]